jgi:adenine deaminase
MLWVTFIMSQRVWTSRVFYGIFFIFFPVIPELKLTDSGLFDVEKFEYISLFNKEWVWP